MSRALTYRNNKTPPSPLGEGGGFEQVRVRSQLGHSRPQLEQAHEIHRHRHEHQSEVDEKEHEVEQVSLALVGGRRVRHQKLPSLIARWRTGIPQVAAPRIVVVAAGVGLVAVLVAGLPAVGSVELVSARLAQEAIANVDGDVVRVVEQDVAALRVAVVCDAPLPSGTEIGAHVAGIARGTGVETGLLQASDDERGTVRLAAHTDVLAVLLAVA